MWDDHKRQRFRALDNKKWNGGLTPAEQDEWAALVAEVEAEEAARLRPAMERMDREREQIEAHTRQLQGLVERRERLLAHLENVLAELWAEHRAIQEETAHLLKDGATQLKPAINA